MMKQIEARRNRMLVSWYDAGSDFTAATAERTSKCTSPACRGECGNEYAVVRRLAWEIRHAPLNDPARTPVSADGKRRA